MAASRRGLLAAFHVALALYTQGAGAALPAPVADELSKVRIPEEAVSVWVQQVGQPEPEVAHYPDRPMNPASYADDSSGGSASAGSSQRPSYSPAT